MYRRGYQRPPVQFRSNASIPDGPAKVSTVLQERRGWTALAWRDKTRNLKCRCTYGICCLIEAAGFGRVPGNRIRGYFYGFSFGIAHTVSGYSPRSADPPSSHRPLRTL